MKKLNWHSIRTISLIVIIFLLAGIQAVHGMTPFDEKLDMLATLLLAAEHMLEGKFGLFK